MRVIVSRVSCVLGVLVGCSGGGGASTKTPSQHDASVDPAQAGDAGPDAAVKFVGEDAGGDTGQGSLRSDAGPVDAADAAVLGCVRDSDCDDGDPCTGSEHCTDRVCVAGSAPCSNPDPAHCSATCVAEAGSPSCSLAARDADGDGDHAPGCQAGPSGFRLFASANSASCAR